MKLVGKIIIFGLLMFLMTCDGIFANIAIREKRAKIKLEAQKTYFYKNYRNMDLDEQTEYLKSMGCRFTTHSTKFSNIDVNRQIYNIIKRST